VAGNEINDYYDGVWNRSFRHYYYMKKAVQEANEFRNIIYVIAGVLALKVLGLKETLVLTLGILLVLDLAGYVLVHHTKKREDAYNTYYSTVYSIQNFNYIQRQTELLEDILGELKK
jgi:hypothetical protein